MRGSKGTTSATDIEVRRSVKSSLKKLQGQILKLKVVNNFVPKRKNGNTDPIWALVLTDINDNEVVGGFGLSTFDLFEVDVPSVGPNGEPTTTHLSGDLYTIAETSYTLYSGSTKSFLTAIASSYPNGGKLELIEVQRQWEGRDYTALYVNLVKI